ncbi:hypothetical protein [Xanthomonas prunicola]|uniref:hypothetical protein n=1 Tax=Xanthomonas prunicola TaxID=2053930 RepID=UPI001054F4EC|nr:hypothetical protein [Xanthomonas prunicola]
MTTLKRNLLRAASCLHVVVAGWCFLAAWYAPDGCLDQGGSFDDVAWKCSATDDHPYMDIHADQFVSFWQLLASVVAALLLLVRPASVLQRCRPASSGCVTSSACLIDTP